MVPLPPQVALQTTAVTVGGLAALVVASAGVYATVEVVGPTEVRVVERGGQLRRVLDPGVGFVAPLVSDVHRVERRPQSFSVSATATSGDRKRVEAEVTVEVAVEDPELLFEATDGFEQSYRHHLTSTAEEVLQRHLGRVPLRATLSAVSDPDAALTDRVAADVEAAVEEYGLVVTDVEFESAQRTDDAWW